MENKKNFWKNDAVQSVISSLICIVLGILIGYIALLIINPHEANEGIVAIIKNFANYPTHNAKMKYFGATLVKTAPLLLCALSVQFCFKAGLFNIGVAGQYVAGAGAALYAGLYLHCNWFVCLILAIIAGAVLGAISGLLKAYRNVNEVISGIMLNWIFLYIVNMMLTVVKEETSPYTVNIKDVNPGALLPNGGMDTLISNKYATIAIPLSILIAIGIDIVLRRTKFGYELKATGYNKSAAQYAGMKEKRNLVLTLMIGGALAGCGAAFIYLTGIEQWQVTQSSVPAMGFNGIAATFLGGLNPIGTIFSSYFIEHITLGGSYLNKAVYPSQISDLISAIIIYLCGFVLFFKHVMNTRIAKKEEKEIQMAKSEKGGENK